MQLGGIFYDPQCAWIRYTSLRGIQHSTRSCWFLLSYIFYDVLFFSYFSLLLLAFFCCVAKRLCIFNSHIFYVSFSVHFPALFIIKSCVVMLPAFNVCLHSRLSFEHLKSPKILCEGEENLVPHPEMNCSVCGGFQPFTD